LAPGAKAKGTKACVRAGRWLFFQRFTKRRTLS
jgi:ribosomal 50S subunit-recycling heat shock protein